MAFASNERRRIRKKIKDSINSLFQDYKETYYIPAGRSMITLLVNNRSMVKNENNLDLITRQFMQTIDSIHADFSEGIRNVHKRFPDGERKFDVVRVAELLIGDLKGDYRYAPGKEYIILEGENEKTEIPINFASSGQQEVLWLLNLLYYLMLIKETAFVIIEEPEAHLYPSLQKKVVDFIVFFMNINESSVFITSHSPYILTACNTLYCAGKLLQAAPEAARRVRDIVGNGRELRPDIFSAFKIQKDGILINLIDDEMQEITTDLIDEISDIINGSYVDLFYLNEELKDMGGMDNAREI